MRGIYGQDFIRMVKSINPAARAVSGDSEILMRCPYCGDSQNIRHAHFYVSVPTSPTDLSFYQCKKCPSRGIVGSDLLRKIGCNDASVLVQMDKHNNDVLKLPKYKTLRKINIYPLQNKYIRKASNNQQKLEYINHRIGSSFTYQDLLRLKIVLNLYDVINPNRLELTRHKNVVDALDENFVGFISFDNAFCNMRKVTDKKLYEGIDKRYVNYGLVNKTNNEKNYYVIPTSLDVLNLQPIKIHIAEGPFDILSVYYNLNQCNTFQNIYISCSGKQYLNAVRFITREFGLILFEIHYYPDADVTDYQFERYLSPLKQMGVDLYIHRNLYPGEKDFGVPMYRIKESIRYIKGSFL